jgi:hypothetical protein
MLLWTRPIAGPDDDEKGGKLRRQAQTRVQNALISLVVLSVIFLISMVHLRHASNTAASLASLLRAGPRPLPANSIYRLSALDIFNDVVPFNQFIGKVTLIVNTACQ